MMRNPRNLLIFAFCGGVVGTAFGLVLAALWPASNETAKIEAVMQAQEAAWNRGDIPAFMEGYQKGEDLRFASGGKVNTGWQTTLDGYLARYPDDGAMGQLAFDLIDIEQIDRDDAVVFGRWELTRASDKPSGLFTLRFHKTKGRWEIISDHTSSAE